MGRSTHPSQIETITNELNSYPLDLHGFIDYLVAEHPEEIIRITKQVDPKFGVSGILHRLEKDGQFPLVIFENVKGSNFPLIANMNAKF